MCSSVKLSIDDGPKATLVFGQSVSWDVPAGAHVLKANTIWKKVPFSAGAGETVEFIIANRASRMTSGTLPLADGRRAALSDD